MLRDAAVNLIALRLGKRTDLNDQIIAEMQLVQEVLERGELMPFFLLSEMATTSTTAEDERLVLPGDFLQEFEEGALWYQDEDEQWYPLQRAALEEIKGAFDVDSSTGYPQYYSLMDNYFRLAPVPDAAYVIKMVYYAQDTVLATNIENNWLKYATEWFITEVGVRVAAYIQNDKMVNVFTQNVQAAKDRFWRFNESRKHSNQDYRMEFK